MIGSGLYYHGMYVISNHVSMPQLDASMKQEWFVFLKKELARGERDGGKTPSKREKGNQPPHQNQKQQATQTAGSNNEAL